MIKRFNGWFRKLLADTSAYTLYRSIIGIFTAPIELLWIGLNPLQLSYRLAYGLITFSFSRYCGWINDKMYARLMNGSKSLWRKSISSGTILSLYQLPVLIVCTIVWKFDITQIYKLCILTVVDNLITGLGYEYLLTKMRGRLKKTEPAQAAPV